MTIKRPTLLAVLTLALAIIAGWLAGRTTAAQASQSSAVTPQQQPVSSDQKAGTWEYRILKGPLDSVVKYSYTYKGRQMTSPGPYLEEEINKLAAQGFVVESFQLTTSVGGTGTGTSFSFSSISISSATQIVVTMKRIKN